MKYIHIKSLLILFAISITASHVSAQGPFASFNLGYAFKTGTQNLPGIYNSSNPGGGGIRSYEQINTSLGKGFNIGGAFGYMFNKNIGVELGLSYLIGAKTSAMHTNNNGNTEYILSANMFRLNPSIMIASGFEKLNPYAKFGIVVGFGSVLQETNDYNNGNIENIQIKSNGGSALGLSSAVGVLYTLNEKIALFGELNMINLSYAPKKSVMIKDNYNGIDQLPGMNIREKETNYVDNYTYDPSSPTSDGLPDTALKTKLPFGSLGINIGVKINL